MQINYNAYIEVDIGSVLIYIKMGVEYIYMHGGID